MNNKIIKLIEQHFGNEKYSMFQQLNKIEDRLIDLQYVEECNNGNCRCIEELEEQNAFYEEIYMLRKFQNFMIDLQFLIEKECDKIYS